MLRFSRRQIVLGSRQRGFAITLPSYEGGLQSLRSARASFLQTAPLTLPDPVPDFSYRSGCEFSFHAVTYDRNCGCAVATMGISKEESWETVVLTREQAIRARQTYPDLTGGSQTLLVAINKIEHLNAQIRALRRS